MCTKKTLYMAGDEKEVCLRSREKGGKLNFSQISYATDCVREFANRMDVPMAKVIGTLRQSGAFQLIYKESRKVNKKTAKMLARELVVSLCKSDVMKNMYLFHGSDRRIDTPRWDVGDEGRDFGKCFYTTYDRRTAKNWALKNFNDHQVVNRYAIDLERLSDGRLKIKRFEANAQWAEFVWNNRYNTKFKRPNYDIIIGPMADRGLKEQFIKMKTKGMTFAEIAPLIHYDRFRSMQVCFCSDYAIRMLNLID